MDCSAVQPPLSPPLHISNRCEIPQQHPLHVDTWLETKKKFLKILSFFGGTVPLSWIVSVTGNYGCQQVQSRFYVRFICQFGIVTAILDIPTAIRQVLSGGLMTQLSFAVARL